MLSVFNRVILNNMREKKLQLQFTDDIYLTFNVDGIPKHKSTSKETW